MKLYNCHRSLILTVSLVLSGTTVLTGCSGFHKLDRPYTYADRPDFYASEAAEGKAVPFAADLCVITADSENQDAAVNAEAAALFDITDHSVLYSHQAMEKLYPASVTKIMTALLVVKYGNLTDTVTVTDDAVITEAGATLCRIKPGDKLTLEQLLYGLMLPSGNDAGAAIAVHMSGGIDQFAGLMNEEARKLGATGSHFVNPHGLHDDNHYTTAYDLYLIFNEALKYPEFCKVIGTASYEAAYVDQSGKDVTQTWNNTNLYMTGERATPRNLTVLGGKTGTTKAAGSCLIMGSQSPGQKEYISVVMKAEGRPNLYDNMTNILNKIDD